MANVTMEFTNGFIVLALLLVYVLAYLARLVNNFKQGLVMQTPTLPLPHLLVGPEDFELWDMSLIKYLQYYGLSSHLLDDVPGPLIGPARVEWMKDKARVNYVLLYTLSGLDVIVALKLYNWSIKEEDPKVTYDLIKHIFAHDTGDFVALRRDECSSMSEYLQRLQLVRDQLEKHGQKLDTRHGLRTVLDTCGLKEDHPTLHAKLLVECTLNRLPGRT